MPSPKAKQPRQQSLVIRLSAIACAAMLTACAGIPLPPWPDGLTQSRPAPAGPASAQAARPSNPANGAVSTPVAPISSLNSLVFAETDAVAQRFPDPGIRYDTPGLAAQRNQFTTNAELSGWLRKIASASNSQTHLSVVNIGLSQRAIPIEALIATKASDPQPASLNNSGRPTVLLVAQQHGDEPAGAEALMVIARELAPGGLLEPLLQKINVIVVPRANPDGSAVSARTTGDGTDLNNDHLELQTPEAKALAMLARDYRPISVIDLQEHAAAGINLQKFANLLANDTLLQYAGTPNVHEFITKANREWMTTPIRSALEQAQLSSDWYYSTSNSQQDKTISSGTLAPDTLINISALKNAVSYGISSRGSDLGRAHIQRRVHSLVVGATGALHASAERANNLTQVRSFVSRDVASQACRKELTVLARPMVQQRTLTMINPQSGQDQQVTVDFLSTQQAEAVLTRPRPCGYWLSSNATSAVERLRQLGLQVQRIAEPGQMLADSYNDAVPIGNNATSKGMQLTRGAIEADVGSFYVSLNQANANLAVAALEPDTAYSFVASGLISDLSDVARVAAQPSVVFEEDTD